MDQIQTILIHTRLFFELFFTVAVPCLGTLWLINKFYEHWRLDRIRRQYTLKPDRDDDLWPNP